MEPKSILLTPPVSNSVCANLSFSEILKFKEVLGLPVLNCPISVRDPITSQIVILPEVSFWTTLAYRLIDKFGLDGALFEVAKHHSFESRNILKYSEIQIELSQLPETDLTKLALILLKAGANIEFADSDGQTVLMAAASAGENELVKILLAAGANVNAIDKGEETALMAAVLNYRNDVIQTLLAAGADINVENCFAQTALDRALEIQKIFRGSNPALNQIIKLLKEAGTQ